MVIPGHWCKELIMVYTLFLGEASSSENTFVSCSLQVNHLDETIYLSLGLGNVPHIVLQDGLCIHPTWHHFKPVTC